MLRCLALLLPLTLLAVPASAQQQEEARKLLIKVIRAKGGEKLHKIEAYHVHLRTTDYQSGQKDITEGRFGYRGVEHARSVVGNGLNETVVIFNRDRGWVKANGQVREMTPLELEGQRENAYLAWVSVVLPIALREDFVLSRLPDDIIQNRAVLGLRIAHKGRPFLDLWVDAVTHQVKRQRYRTLQADGKEVEYMTWIGGHKFYDGIGYYTFFTTYRDGVLLYETVVVDARFHVDGRKIEFSRP